MLDAFTGRLVVALSRQQLATGIACLTVYLPYAQYCYLLYSSRPNVNESRMLCLGRPGLEPLGGGAAATEIAKPTDACSWSGGLVETDGPTTPSSSSSLMQQVILTGMIYSEVD